MDRIRTNRVIQILGFAAFFCLSPMSRASSFVHQTFPEAVEDASVIVRGQATDATTRWVVNGDGARKIYTYWGFQVDELLKGEVPSRQISIRQLGGEKDGVGMHVPGGAKLEIGQDGVVFLSPPGPDGSYEVRSWSLGQYQMSRGADGVEKLTGGRISGDHLADQMARRTEPQAGIGQNTSVQNAPTSWTLSALKDLIAQQVSGKKSLDASGSRKEPQTSPSAASPLHSVPVGPSQTQPGDPNRNSLPAGSESTSGSVSLWTVFGALLIFAGLIVFWVSRR